MPEPAGALPVGTTFHVLGNIGWRHSASTHTLSGARQRLLLGLLLLHAPGPVPVERLASLLGDDVYLCVHRLRRVLDRRTPGLGAALRTLGGAYALQVDAAGIDAAELRRHAADAAAGGRPDLRAVEAGLDLWTGPPLGSLYDSVADWTEVRALVRAHADLCVAWFEGQVGSGPGTLDRARELAARHPADGEVQVRYARTLQRASRTVDALAVLDRYAKAAAGAGATPGPDALALRSSLDRLRPEPAAGRTDRWAVGERDSVLVALDRAATFAADAGAHAHATDLLQLMLRTVGTTDPRRPHLLLRLAQVRYDTSGAGAVEAREALAGFASAGDREAVTSAHLVLARVAWAGDDGAAVRTELFAARRSMGVGPLSVQNAATMSNLLAAVGQPTEAEQIAERILSGPAGGDEWQRARLLAGRGFARATVGDARAAADYSEAAVRHQNARGWVPVSCHVNLDEVWATLGRLDRARDAAAQARRTAMRQASVLDLRSTAVDSAWHQFWAGRVTEPAVTVRDWHADPAADRHFSSALCLCLGARLATADRNLAVAGRLSGLALSRTARGADPDTRLAALVIAAMTALRYGDPGRRARPLLDEALVLATGRFLPAEIGIEFPVAMLALGIPARRLEDIAPSPWRSAARLVLRGERAAAARLYTRIGSRPDADAAVGGRPPGATAPAGTAARQTPRTGR